MKSKPSSHIITVGLAIFSMLFGAGNLMYPLDVGMHAGVNTFVGMVGFIMTAICLPLAGLIAMILFDGNYEEFFNRLGSRMGSFIIFLCMIIIGPIIAIPRIVTLSHTMIAPFLPFSILKTVTPQSSFLFALGFLGVTFLATFRENRIVDLLGKVISPLLLISLLIIIAKGIFTANVPIASSVALWDAFKVNFIRGYETLDLLGGIFFSSIVIHILKNTEGGKVGFNRNRLALIGFKAGLLGVSLLGLVYSGMSILSMYHGHGLIGSGSLFRELAFRVLGGHGAFIIGTAVLMACLSTSIALAAVVGEYFQVTVFNRKVSYISSLIILLMLCIPLSTYGLDYVRQLTGGPLVYIGYPAIIMLTFCNIAYKLFDFKPVKIPVALTFIAALVSYFWI
jgi:LIVCS family branched-chain amino acid:cation transporter